MYSLKERAHTNSYCSFSSFMKKEVWILPCGREGIQSGVRLPCYEVPSVIWWFWSKGFRIVLLLKNKNKTKKKKKLLSSLYILIDFLVSVVTDTCLKRGLYTVNRALTTLPIYIGLEHHDSSSKRKMKNNENEKLITWVILCVLTFYFCWMGKGFVLPAGNGRSCKPCMYLRDKENCSRFTFGR